MLSIGQQTSRKVPYGRKPRFSITGIDGEARVPKKVGERYKAQHIVRVL